jgi:hypothetical protein
MLLKIIVGTVNFTVMFIYFHKGEIPQPKRKQWDGGGGGHCMVYMVFGSPETQQRHWHGSHKSVAEVSHKIAIQ